MKLHFDKSLGQAFSKACGVLGQRPKVLKNPTNNFLSLMGLSVAT